MTQTERRTFLIQELLREQPQYSNMKIPSDEQGQKNLLRSLFNIRMPKPVNKTFLEVQNTYLQEEIKNKGITQISSLEEVEKGIYLWQGDITTLCCEAIVNAANKQLLGCFYPCHGCIDNAIHTFSGVQLRLACAEIMSEQGHEEPVGKVKITKAYNLPCKYILHTVGPVVYDYPTQENVKQLTSCYRSCLELAEKNNIKNIAFCCISTGEFHFPNYKAAEIAVKTVKEYRKKTDSKIEVIFNVFKDEDYKIYRGLLGIH